MNFADTNWLAVVAATLIIFILGAIWYGPKTLYPIWWKLMGHELKRVENPADSMAKVFGLTGIGAFVQALFLSVTIHSLEVSTLTAGLFTGLVIGIGFTAAPALSHRMFANANFNRNGVKIWAIETFPDVFNLAIAGALLAIW